MAFKETLDMTKHALTTNLACIYIFSNFLLIRKNERKACCYHSKGNYYENYHLMTGVLQNFDANLKRLL